MAIPVDALVVGRVIGDVVDMFEPSVGLTVIYGTKYLTNGCDVVPSMAAAAPAVQIGGQRGDLFSLVMTDPDAPTPSQAIMKEWLHWMVVNIPGGTNPSQGQEVVTYMGPLPALGTHRYVLVLFKQKERLSPPGTGAGSALVRMGFSTRVFAERHDLGHPVAAVYFNAEKEPTYGRRRRHI